jgi:hypothetical protein
MRWKTRRLVLAMLMGAALMAAGQFVVDCRARRAYWLDRAEQAARSVEKKAERASQFEADFRKAEADAIRLLSSPGRSVVFRDHLDYLNQEMDHQRKAAARFRGGIDRDQIQRKEFARRAARPWSHPIPG